MAVELYPDLFQNFFHEMEQPTSLNDGFQKAFELLEHPLHIGKVNVSFRPRRPGFVSGAKNANINMVVFESKRSFNSEVNQTYQFIMQDEIIVEITIFATTSCDQWSMKAIASLATIAETTYVFASRLRLADIAQSNAMTDTLTGLPNYVSFCTTGRAHCTVGSIGRYTAVLINIRGFNDINFNHGFVMGDQVLRKYGAFLQTGMLPEETVARHGGDSFVMLVKKDRAADIVEKVSKTNITAIASDASEIPLTIEADVTSYDIPEGTMDFSTCLMELSKRIQERIGREAVNDKTEKVDETVARLEEFNKLLKSDCFTVHYQPKVSLEDRSILGAEALVRRIDGDEILLPEEFLPELNEDERICLLDYYVLDLVCQDLFDWLNDGNAPLVSVNFSIRHLSDDGFVERIMNIIDRYGIDPSYIEIEFTSLPPVKDYPRFKEFIEKMQSYDLTVSLDDFGNGSSAITSLTELGANVLKIDQSLTEHIGDKNIELMIKTLMDIASDREMEVIAEGVETEEQEQFYKDAGCLTAQGYLFYKPMSREELDKKL
ncbi:MAG: bifunctional diguanylate cyclase/phosphodiesterase [Lachnospiraceae bacterium]|nr:bifunctional diguanylate cyclase/phosphodiesterase [Lachnospiraceae bacterium]